MQPAAAAAAAEWPGEGAGAAPARTVECPPGVPCGEHPQASRPQTPAGAPSA